MNHRHLLYIGAVAATVAACAPASAPHTSPRVAAPHAGHAAPRVDAARPAPTLGFDTTNFDRSVRPQDDFFRFANGGWLARTEIPSDRSRFGSFDELREQSQIAVRTLIEETAAREDVAQGSDAQKVRDLYRSYMDTVTIENLGVEPVRPGLDRIAALSDRDELPALFAELARSGIQTPVGFYVGQDGKQATRYIAYASQSGTGLPDRDYYLKPDPKFEEVRGEYVDYIATLLRLAGQPDPDRAAANVLALETRLAEAQWTRVQNRDREATYNLKTLDELEALTPGFSWSRYLEAVGAERTPGVVVRQPDYFQELDAILAETPLPVIRQYLVFKLLDDASSLLSRPFREARFAFRGQVLSGQKEQSPRWKQAVGTVDRVLGEATGRMYVERHFTPDQKARMEELVSNLTAAFREGIEGLEWMSPETKAQAQQKLAKFNVKIGYPEEWEDYSALEIRPDDLAGNMRRAAVWGFEDMVSRLGQPIDRGEWGMTPQTVNAYYSSTMNEIVFPAAILQPPFFDPAADDAVNYGAIGAVIGHEISHGFDDQGSRSDGDGNLRNWWTEQDQEEFAARTGELAAQYDAYEPLPGESINGRLTLGENIGDLSGLSVAYKAYRRSLGGQPAPVIAGFTGDQRFFLGWAQIWRSKSHDEALRQQLLTDPHSPGEYRTNGVLTNIPAFYDAFDVEEGDGMYIPPEERVKIW
jgi:putative endopeptidase